MRYFLYIDSSMHERESYLELRSVLLGAFLLTGIIPEQIEFYPSSQIGIGYDSEILRENRIKEEVLELNLKKSVL